MRGGIGSAWRLGAEAHKSPNFWLDTLPRPERLKKNPTRHRQGRSTLFAVDRFDVFRCAILAASNAAVSMVVQLEPDGLEAVF
jgi:hypothetical protein